MISSFLDEELYAGIPQLGEGLNYISCDDCRRNFVQRLCRGLYYETPVQRKSLRWSLGKELLTWNLDIMDIMYTIRTASEALERSNMPGSWHDYEEQ